MEQLSFKERVTRHNLDPPFGFHCSRSSRELFRNFARIFREMLRSYVSLTQERR